MTMSCHLLWIPTHGFVHSETSAKYRQIRETRVDCALQVGSERLRVNRFFLRANGAVRSCIAGVYRANMLRQVLAASTKASVKFSEGLGKRFYSSEGLTATLFPGAPRRQAVASRARAKS